jgi:SAM-dependent methyltransferase
LDLFYADEYYENLKDRAPDLDKFMAADNAEINWLSGTLWNDIDEILSHRVGAPSKLLDWGCGTGHFLNFMRQRGWDTWGIEPSTQAARYATNQFSARIFLEPAKYLNNEFGAVTLLNVLEHVRDPEALINKIHSALRKHGVLAIRVPNDFSELQSAAKIARGKNKQWWVKSPDHINYFDFDSISRLLSSNGFYVVDELGDFPMEFFIMFGDDYIDNPEIGKLCHEKRRKLELALPTALRQNMYRDFAKRDIGRNCLVFAVKE